MNRKKTSTMETVFNSAKKVAMRCVSIDFLVLKHHRRSHASLLRYCISSIKRSALIRFWFSTSTHSQQTPIFNNSKSCQVIFFSNFDLVKPRQTTPILWKSNYFFVPSRLLEIKNYFFHTFTGSKGRWPIVTKKQQKNRVFSPIGCNFRW